MQLDLSYGCVGNGNDSDGTDKAGMPEDMPAAVIERGTTARQRQVCATVKNIKAAGR